MNRKKSVDDSRNNIITPLDNMFDDYHACAINWCYKKSVEEDNIMKLDENEKSTKVGYYM